MRAQALWRTEGCVVPSPLRQRREVRFDSAQRLGAELPKLVWNTGVATKADPPGPSRDIISRHREWRNRMTYDLLVRGGMVVDGTNSPPFRADIAVSGDRIVALAPDLSDEDALQVIDATDRVVSPGFVDTHTHYDAQIHWDPTLDLSSHHGFTTFIAGNCGLSMAPVNSSSATYLMSALSKVEGIPLATLREGVEVRWSSFGELLDALDGHVAVNIGFTVGHSALRATVMGDRCLESDATPEELDAMRALLRESIEAGALGFSSSNAETHTDMDRRPVASRCASRTELFSLTEVLRDYEGTKLEFAPNASMLYDEDLRQWVAQLAATAGRTLDIPIILDQSMTDDEIEDMFKTSEAAKQAGGRALMQVVAQTTSLFFNLRSGFLYEALASPWPEFYALSHEERLRLLHDEHMLDQLEAAAESEVERGGNLSKAANFSTLIVASVVSAENEKYLGRPIGEIAEDLGLSPFRAAVQIALRDDLLTALEDRPPESMSGREGWVRRVGYLRDERGLISGTDAGAHYDVIDTYAQSSRFIHNAVNRFGMMPIEEAVHRMTQIPAEMTGLVDRGTLKTGNFADILVFDADAMDTTSTELVADLPGGGNRLVCKNIGIDHVIVNGVPRYEMGKYSGSLSGTVLRSGRDTTSLATG
jgi:N-acyl-D-aspartate/D-glutamate deacylase